MQEARKWLAAFSAVVALWALPLLTFMLAGLVWRDDTPADAFLGTPTPLLFFALIVAALATALFMLCLAGRLTVAVLQWFGVPV